MRGYWIFSIMFLGIILFSVTAYAQSSAIPDWIKNNAGWWSEDAISDEDYISGLQYLITQEIIKIPIKQVIATDTTISDEERAHSFIVRIKFSEGEKTFYSFSRIVEFNAPQLQLESIPSLDKSRFYDEVEVALKFGTDRIPMDIMIDVIAKNGLLIETLEYRSCIIDDHWVYVNDDKEKYRFTNTDGPEIREVTNFDCKGYKVTAP